MTSSGIHVRTNLRVETHFAAGQDAHLIFVDRAELTAERASNAGAPGSIAIAPTEAERRHAGRIAVMMSKGPGMICRDDAPSSPSMRA